jgi:hypothetical protein
MVFLITQQKDQEKEIVQFALTLETKRITSLKKSEIKKNKTK